jgi:hypothetical protein
MACAGCRPGEVQMNGEIQMDTEVTLAAARSIHAKARLHLDRDDVPGERSALSLWWTLKKLVIVKRTDRDGRVGECAVDRTLHH